jgi:16S rRNA C967 or C1407 C5-methylase (RsmB/RsmF family)
MQILEDLQSLQRGLVASAVQFLRPTGRLVYITSSILKEENEYQVRMLTYFPCRVDYSSPQLDFFKSEFGLTLEGKPFQTLPTPGGCDGYFAATLLPPKDNE